MVGESVGEYRIVRELGRGRAGSVYLAESPRHARPVALKLPIAGAGEDARVRMERFLSDAEAASALRHPGIVSVLAQGFTDAGQAFVVTEHLEGTTLRGWLAESVASGLTVRVSIARQVAAAGAAVHDNGIVHGALRPENVFLVGGAPEAVKVTDFGLGRLLRAGTIDELVYASPERCRRPGKTDVNDDVYAFGCVLYEMLCGRPPFPYRDRDALMAAHLGEPPPAPRSVEASVPVGIERLILAMLCKAPGGRPRSLRAVDEALAHFELGGADDGGWPARREQAAMPRLTPLGHVHLRSRELRTGMPSASETPIRRTPLGQAHLRMRGLVVDHRLRPSEPRDVPRPPAVAEDGAPAVGGEAALALAEEAALAAAAEESLAAAAEEAALRSGPRLWWLLGLMAILAGTVLAVRVLRAPALDGKSPAVVPATLTR
jgi:serine/threonine protein kinase